MEQLIFNTWKVGEVIEFPDVEVKWFGKSWSIDAKYSKHSFDSHKNNVAIKSEFFRDEEHLCFDFSTKCKWYYMIPKSELIRIGMLPQEETKEEMKVGKNDKEFTLKEAIELYNQLDVPYLKEAKKTLESYFPELKPKLITDVVKTVEDAHKYVLKENIPYHNNLYYTYQDSISNNSHAGIQRLAHVLNEDWRADYDNPQQAKCFIAYTKDAGFYTDYTYEVITGSIYFKSMPIANHALKHNQQLFNDLFKVK